MKLTSGRIVGLARRLLLPPIFICGALVTPAGASDGSFVTTGSLNIPRVEHTATLLPDGKVLITGGVTGSALSSVSSAELYDPATGVFSLTGSMAVPRRGHVAVLLPNGQVLVAGGLGESSAELFDPVTGTFSPTGPMAEDRLYATATLLAGGKVLVAGGSRLDGSDLVLLASAEVYDPASGTFSGTGDMNAARGLHTAVLLPGGTVFIAGGGTLSGLNTAELYDPAAGTFTYTTGTMTTERSQHTATLLSDGTVLLTGGFRSSSATGHLASAEVYDPTTEAFSPTGSMTARRALHTATRLASGDVLIAGGESVWDLEYPADGELYSQATTTFTLTGAMSTPRAMPTATLLLNGQVLIAGGADFVSAGGPLDAAELFVPVEPVLAVAIDIRPGTLPNNVNLRSRGTLPVAILSAAAFDARTVDPRTVTLAGAPVRLRGSGAPMASFEDVNGDGRLDLVVHVDTAALLLTPADTEAVLNGSTFGGRAIRGQDSVRVTR